MPARSLPAAAPIAAFAVAFLVVLVVVASWTIPGEPSRLVPGAIAIAVNGGTAALWWVGAAGLGLWLGRAALRPTVRAISDLARGGEAKAQTSRDDLAIGLALGAAAQIALVHALGSVGLLALGGGLVAWIPPGLGIFLGARTLRDAPPERTEPASGRWTTLVAPAIVGAFAALFLAAAASAPGWLWSSEFAGFDALSYHLELPKEWIMSARPVGPVDGNVYSALPSFVEGVFMQLMLLRGAVVQGALACQFWAAFAALATAWVVGRLARAIAGPSDALGMLAFLSVPWVLVVGTLAYNDIAPCLMLAGAWLVIERPTEGAAGEPSTIDARAAAVLALCAAVAVGAKPTAFLFVALPLLAIVVMRCGTRTLRLAPLVVGVALVVLAPWLVRNQLAYGNPLFPFAHTLLGGGSWTPEQFEAFAKGHGSALSIVDRLPLLWSEWLAHGLGEAPGPNEPWFPQWGLLPAAGVVGLAIEAFRSARARAAVVALAIALAGWLLATHLKSRFLLPTAVPLSIGAVFLLLRVARATQPVVAQLLVAPALVLPFVVLWREPAKPLASAPDAPPQLLQAPAAFLGDTSFMTGERFARDIERASPEDRARLAPNAPTTYFFNFALPKEARILAVGYSTPFYLGRPVAWNTVWDRGALDRVASENPGTPNVWGAKLHALGFTHVLVHPTMLVVWERSGWLNPEIAPKRWLTAFLQSNPTIRTSDGCFIVELRPASEAAPAATSQPAAGAPPAPPAPAGG